MTGHAFSVIESLVVLVAMVALFFVLAPPLAYQMGWLTPPPRDMDVQIRDVRHPSAKLRTTTQIKTDSAGSTDSPPASPE